MITQIFVGIVFISVGFSCYMAVIRYRSGNIWLVSVGIACVVIGVLLLASTMRGLP